MSSSQQTPDQFTNTNIQKKKHNVADTSRAAYSQLIASGQIERERQKVLRAIKELQPCSSRMLMNHLGLERGNVTRSLFDLVNADNPLAQIAFKDKCKTTGITVRYYSLIENKEAE